MAAATTEEGAAAMRPKPPQPKPQPQQQQQPLQQQPQRQPQQQPQPQIHQPGGDQRGLIQAAAETLRHGPKPAISLGASNRAPATARRRVPLGATQASQVAGVLHQTSGPACGSQTPALSTDVEGQQQRTEEPSPTMPATESQPDASEANVLSMLNALEDLAGVLEERQASSQPVVTDDGATPTNKLASAEVGAVSSTAAPVSPQNHDHPQQRPMPTPSSEEAVAAAPEAPSAAAAAADLGTPASKEISVDEQVPLVVDRTPIVQRCPEPQTPQPTRQKPLPPQSSPDVARTLQALEALAGLLETPNIADGSRERKAAHPKPPVSKVDAVTEDASTATTATDTVPGTDEDPLSKLEWLLCKEEEAKSEKNGDIEAWNPLGADGVADFDSSPGVEEKLEMGSEGLVREDDHSQWESLWRSSELRWSPKPLPVIHLP